MMDENAKFSGRGAVAVTDEISRLKSECARLKLDLESEKHWARLHRNERDRAEAKLRDVWEWFRDTPWHMISENSVYRGELEQILTSHKSSALLKVEEWAKRNNQFDNYKREAAKEVLAILGRDTTTPSWEDECGS